MKNLVELAKDLCIEKHEGQYDKAGEPYAVHPIAVAASVEGDEVKMAAYLHDVVEDTDTTLNDLSELGFPNAVVAAVDALTRRDYETYEVYLERLAGNPIAVKVKLADLAHNLSPERTGATEEMRARYKAAQAFLAQK